MGQSSFSAFLTWLVLAQTVPAAVTLLVGDERTIDRRIEAYYRSTWTCGYALEVEEVNPVFGRYCQAGTGPNDFRRGGMAHLTVRESVLGTFVKHISSN